MPLPPASARSAIHTRIFDCRGYEREDGLWDVDGRMTDAKTYTWKNRGGIKDLAAGEYAHDMWMRLTLDLDMLIHDAIAVTDAGPHLPCGDITPKFSLLKGRRITRGWTKELREVLGGANGCTHHWELLGRLATVAYQTMHRARNERRPYQPGQRPSQFNNCHMYTAASEETLHRWPELYTGPNPRPALQRDR
jgi:hypothetical protein